LLAALPRPAPAQTLANPDISVIGDFRLAARSGEFADAAGARQVQFEFEELEFNFNGYLNPYMRADVTVAIPDFESLDLEEASMTVLRGLPLSTQFRVGKYFLDFGKLNTQHPHQWPWMEPPLMMRTMLGEEGLRPLGAQLSTLQAAGESAVTLSLNAFRGDGFAHEHGAHAHEADEDESPPETMFSGRLSWFHTFDVTSVEAGLSALGGRYDAAEALDVTMGAFDFKLRWRPDTYRSVNVIAESMLSERELVHADTTVSAQPEVQTVRAAGVFTALQVQFRKRWDTGAYFDFSEDAVEEGAKTTAGGAWFAFMPAEETARFNLVYRYETSDLYDFASHGVSLQFLFGLGPHRPHRF
jgi:hypothetical protein